MTCQHCGIEGDHVKLCNEITIFGDNLPLCPKCYHEQKEFLDAYWNMHGPKKDDENT